MINVQEVILDTDMTDPQPFTVQRTLGQWQSTGFVNVQTTFIPVMCPVRVATDRELKMVPEADIVGQTRAFYTPFPLLLVRGNAHTVSTATQTLQGSIPGTVYTITTPPQGGIGNLYKNGTFLNPNTDYSIAGTTITLVSPTITNDVLWFTSPVTVYLQAANSDIIVYDGSLYRVIGVYRTGGSGYWKALATRLQAA